MVSFMYETKPVMVEVVKFDENVELNELAQWCNAKNMSPKCLAIRTKSITRIADFGDYIIKFENGDCLPMKSDEFTATFQLMGKLPEEAPMAKPSNV